MAERGCTNCGRDMDTRYGGHCITCYQARKGLTKGTEEYEAALNAVRAKLGDSTPRARSKKKITPDKKATGKKTGISKVTATDAAIIEHLKEQRDEHLATAKKLDQAIECLS